MPDDDLASVIRHCSRCAAKTELCVTVISFEALVSFDSKVFTACPEVNYSLRGFSRRPIQPLFESGDSKAMNLSLERR